MSEISNAPRALLLAAADILQDCAQQTETLGVALCADPMVASRHLDQLQNIDWLSQSLAQIALVLSADQPAEAARRVALDDLRQRLQEQVFINPEMRQL